MQKIGKEVKIGLAVIGVLLAAFGYVLVKRLTQPADAAAADQTASAAGPTGSAGSRAASDKPTVIAATDSDRPAETAGEPKHSRWTIGPDHGSNAGDAKGVDPAADGKNPFASTSREAAASPDAHSGSLFTHDDNRAGSNQFDGTRRHEGDRDDAHRADPAFNGAVQASDAAPLAPASADPAVPADPHSIFAKTPDNSAGRDKDKTIAGDKPLSDKAGPDPFQHHSADGAAAPDPFQHRTADVAAPGDPFQHKPADADGDSRRPAGQPFADRSSAPANPLTPVDNPALRPTGSADPTADNRNPLRHKADGDNSSAVGVTDTGSRFSNQSRFGVGDPVPNDPVVPPRDTTAVNPGTPVSPVGIRPSAIADALPPRAADSDPAPPGQYIVQPNDNYWTISEKVYGTGGYFKAIFEHNRRQHPKAERLQVGETLFVPDVATLQKNYPDLCPKPGHAAAPQRTMPASARIRPGTKVYVVEEGDTLFNIAKQQLGNSTRWGQIYELNREVLGDKNYDYLKPGMELLIPTSDARPDPIASKPSGTFSQ